LDLTISGIGLRSMIVWNWLWLRKQNSAGILFQLRTKQQVLHSQQRRMQMLKFVKNGASKVVTLSLFAIATVCVHLLDAILKEEKKK
jgi:hypothetical protein